MLTELNVTTNHYYRRDFLPSSQNEIPSTRSWAGNREDEEEEKLPLGKSQGFSQRRETVTLLIVTTPRDVFTNSSQIAGSSRRRQIAYETYKPLGA